METNYMIIFSLKVFWFKIKAEQSPDYTKKNRKKTDRWDEKIHSAAIGKKIIQRNKREKSHDRHCIFPWPFHVNRYMWFGYPNEKWEMRKNTNECCDKQPQLNCKVITSFITPAILLKCIFVNVCGLLEENSRKKPVRSISGFCFLFVEKLAVLFVL